MPEKLPNHELDAMQRLLGNDYERDQLTRDLEEILVRECEALRLYEPMPHQDALHSSKVRTVVMQKGNQVGGTLSFAVEIARAVTGTDPYNKYPKRDGVACILGYGERHIGDVFYPKLFKQGAFDIIKDKETGRWRTYRPWPEAKGGDLERVDEARPAPPLIPPRFLAEEPAWLSRKDRIFTSVRLTTGWELRAYNSAGDPGQAQGFIADLYGIDEDTATTGWVEEILFRLVKKRGLLRWTAKPHGKNDEMLNLLEEAERESKKESPNVVVIRATLYDNKYISEASREETAQTAMAMGEDVYQERVLGNLSLESFLMYPTFNRRMHNVMNDAENRSEAQKILAANNGEPPADWCNYVVCDPGSQVLAILFLTVPPPHLGDQVFAYDECYIRNPIVPVEAFGDAMEAKCDGRTFQAFYIDYHGGKLRGVSSGEWPIHEYRYALEKRSVRSVGTGAGFLPGCDNIKVREEAMRRGLALTRDGWPKFMVVLPRCPNFAMEMERFRKKTQKHGGKDVPLDEGNRRGFTHAIECAEMVLGHGLQYVKPINKPKEGPDWFEESKTWAERQRNKVEMGRRLFGGSNTISLGPLGVN